MTKEEAEAALAVKQAEQAAKDLAAFRAWQAARIVSNVRAAVLLNENAESIYRGAKLNTETPPPPKDAA